MTFDRDEMALVVIASDGVWDVVSNEEAISFLMTEIVKDGGKNMQGAVQRLVQLSIDRGSQDNVSAVCVWTLKNTMIEEMNDEMKIKLETICLNEDEKEETVEEEEEDSYSESSSDDDDDDGAVESW